MRPPCCADLLQKPDKDGRDARCVLMHAFVWEKEGDEEVGEIIKEGRGKDKQENASNTQGSFD